MEGATQVAPSAPQAPVPRRVPPPRSAPLSSSSPSSTRGRQRRNGVLAPGGDAGALVRGGHSLRPSVVFSAQQLHVTVGGCAAFYAAELTCAPEHAVTVAPSNLATSLRVTPSLHVFTRLNWSTPQVFRVAAVGGSALEDSPHGARAIVQAIEHTSSSSDPRFHGSRVLFLPGTIAVHVSPRDGAFVFATGRALATAAQLGKGSATAAHHGFCQLPIDGRANARGSVLAVNAEPANSALARRLTAVRRSVVGDDGTVALPVPPPKDAPSFVKVACRKLQTVLLQRNGVAVVLGKREGAATDSTATASESADAALCKMLTDADCGDDHVVATTEHGFLLTWGDARDGRLGHGTDTADASVAPRRLRALVHKRVVQVACGARHTLALAEDGDVFAWGYGKSGALGLAASEQSKAALESVPTPMEVLALKQKGVALLACGDLHSAAVLASGALLTCGWAEHGRLGRAVPGGAECSGCFAPVDLHGRLCTFVACGGAHTLALTACHGVVAFGANASGQLGLGDCRHRYAPATVAYFGDLAGGGEPLVVASLAAGKAHSVAVAHDARVFAWGSDEFGQCGVGAFPQLYTVPHLVPSAVGLGAAQAACGDAHSVLLAHTSPQQLETLETTHPARYAQLLEKYERFVREDRLRRAAVLLRARQREDAHDAARRQRKPPLDPSLPRGPAWQRQLEAAAAQAQALVESATPVAAGVSGSTVRPRPQTASASLATALARDKLSREGGTAKVRPSTGGTRGPPAVGKPPSAKVRCSSAALWRQTRLFTFQAPPRDSAPPSPLARPPSRPGHNVLKLTAQARQTLGRIFHGDGSATPSATSTGEDDRKKEDHAASVAAFSATRPKSAPSRAAVASTTRAS